MDADSSKLSFGNTAWQWNGNKTYDKDDRIFDFMGTYTFKGNTATMNVTHYSVATGYWTEFSDTWYAIIGNNTISYYYNGLPNGSKAVENIRNNIGKRKY